VAKSERLAHNVLTDLRSMRSNSRATELRSEVRGGLIAWGKGGSGGEGGVWPRVLAHNVLTDQRSEVRGFWVCWEAGARASKASGRGSLGNLVGLCICACC
jgi:hypothetical protein